MSVRAHTWALPNNDIFSSNYKEYYDKKREVTKPIVPPVSYTHLDVYKRQVQSLKKHVKKLESENRFLKSMRGTSKLRNTLLKEQRKVALENLKRQDENLKKLVEDKIKKVLGQIFTETQINCLL